MATSYKKSYGGAVYLTFNDELITLSAADLKKPSFSYKAESFYDAISLGKIDQAIINIKSKFDAATGAEIDETEIKTAIDNLKNIPVLSQILSSELVITEFTIRPADEGATNGKYAFGFGLRLTENNTLGPITLDGVSFSLSLDQQPSA